jgi:ribosomal protein L16 Arg81 hydroxylase
MSIKDFSFNELICPMQPANFFSKYWEQYPLILSGREASYYSNLFSIQDVDSILYFNKPRDVLDMVAVNKGQVQYPTNLNQMYSAYAQGSTINLNHLEYYWKPVASLSSNLESFFNHKVDVAMFLTPKGSQGLAAHFDPYDLFVLQVEGCKKWRIYNCIEFLPIDKQLHPLTPDKVSDVLYEICLNAGDMLYVPRGFVHEALTSESSSLHLTIAIDVFRWTDLIFSAVASVSKQDIRFRKALPVGFINRSELMTSLGDQLTELLKLLLDNAEIENAVDHIAGRCLEDMPPLPDGHFSQIDKLDQINMNTIVAKRKGMRCRVISTEDSASLQFHGNTVKMPASVDPVLRFIADTEEFLVRSIPDVLSDDSKVVLVRRLLREGLLTVIMQSGSGVLLD